jgi:hypothetical protein
VGKNPKERNMGKAFDHYVDQPEPTQKLWRYMDLSKFLSLLHTSSLFFAQWRNLNDPMDGLYHFLEEEISKHPQLRPAYEMLSYCYLVSCWIANQHESIAMWKSYLSGDDGIAIQTTASRLKQSLEKGGIDQGSLFSGLVNYSFGTPPPHGDREGRGLDLIFHKREIFNYEHEYRMIISIASVEAVSLKGGKYVRVDLETLVESIYIAPTAKPWLRQLLSSVAKEQYGLDFEFVDSELLRKPFQT